MSQKSKVQMIQPDAYPQMVNKAQAALMGRELRSPQAAAAAGRVIDNSGEKLRAAINSYVAELEESGSDLQLVSDRAHEIRGFAETAGMLCTGRIADGLCRYFEETGKKGATPDAEVVALHVSSIIRTARDPDSEKQMSDLVARELAVLVAHKLAEGLKNS
jgi:hypothetical protein